MRNVSMNGKFRAKPGRCRPVAIGAVLAILLPGVRADDGNLTQQLQREQNKSSFQLMLEQVRERMRRRAEAGAGPAPREASVAPRDLGDANESVRLEPEPVTIPDDPWLDDAEMRRLDAEQAYERDQKRILDERQRRRAVGQRSLTSGPGLSAEAYGIKRREMVRANSQTRQLDLQRKLRR